MPGAPDTYATFADLYRYCYLVASVVGLVCIRIFGYTDPRAEKLAEETGIAFQLTNILRDVAEDAERRPCLSAARRLGRAQYFARHLACTAAKGTPPIGRTNAPCSPRLAAAREGYYASARALLPLIDRESRPALWVLVRIYRGSAQAHSTGRLRRVFATHRCANFPESRDSRGGPHAHGLGSYGCMTENESIAGSVASSNYGHSNKHCRRSCGETIS